MNKKEEIIKLPRGTKIPNHIAIIPDGNRRWARARGLHTLRGHKAGFEMAVKLARACRQMGVHTTTLWGFSTENWDRTKEEVDYLMRLYVKLIDDYLAEADKEKVKLVHLGRKDRLPKFLIEKIAEAEGKTEGYRKYVANLAIDYGGHDDIIRAVRGMVADGVDAKEVDKKLFEKYLDTKGQPYPYVDLLIRTSGEQRTSGLLLWQMEYAEFYWEQDHFPGFTPEKLRRAVLDYSCRRRRFGGNDEETHLKFKPRVVAGLELDWWRLANIPEGTRFREYAMRHVAEQWGVSKKLAKEAAKYMVAGVLGSRREKWGKARTAMKEFYRLISDEVKLAFEPNLAASLQIKLWQEEGNGEAEEAAREYISEVFRISDLQAKKAAHLRVLAYEELGKENWETAHDYLQKYYEALKDRVA